MNSKEAKRQADQGGWHMDFESMWNQAQMNFCKMWNRLRSELTKESVRVEIGGVARTEVNKILLDMARIEAEEFNESMAAMYSAPYEKKQHTNGEESRTTANAERIARELFEQITGHKVIDSLEELESEIRKRKGKTLYLTPESLSLWMKRWIFRSICAMRRTCTESGSPDSGWTSFPLIRCRKGCS